jgi:type VI secretion system secreted protein Hcp
LSVVPSCGLGNALAVEPETAALVPRRRHRPLFLAGAIVLVAALAFGFVAVRDDGSAPSPRSQPVTLDAALAAFGGATDLYLKLPGIDGGSTNTRHQNEIDIADISWGLSNPNHTTTGATMTDLTITKGIDVASPKLLGAVAAGTNFFAATVSAEKNVGGGAAAIPFAALNLFGVNVTSINQTANRTSGFDEKITLRATVVQLVYTPQKADGSAGTPVSSCWNLATHAAC